MIPQVRPWIGDAERAAVDEVLSRSWLTEGPSCDEFAARLNNLIGSQYGVFAPNGTLALALGLMALGIGPGDEVIIPDITFIGSATSVLMVGASPVFVDVERETFQIDLTSAEMAVTSRTRAIMPVHLYGSACDMSGVMSFAARHDIKVIEDAAQGIGVTHRGRHTGSFGDVGCFSFFADKTVTTGEGGYVATSDPSIYERLRLLRNQGRLERGSFIHPSIGYNFRITEMQGAMGVAQLERLSEIIDRKLRIHAEYQHCLAAIPEVTILGPARDGTFVPFRCVVLADDAEALSAHLVRSGITTRAFFCPLHRQPCFAGDESRIPAHVSRSDDDYPNSCYGYRRGLCLPVFPELELGQVHQITRSIATFFERRRVS